MKPQLGCGAAIFDDTGSLLLVRRRRDPEANCWGLPGGKVEWLESTQEAVVREIREELGVKIQLKGLVCVSELIDPESRAHWVAPVYRAQIVSGIPEVAEPHALSAVDWFDRKNLPVRLTVATRQTLSALTRDPE
jgi:ADP-ribose pyrophosphatase YjhB (NUDIX family)